MGICPGVGLLNCMVALFLFFNFIYPFTYFYYCSSSGSSWLCVGFLWSRWEGLLLAVVLGSSCYGVQAPGRTASVFVVHGLLPLSMCNLPRAGIKPMSLAWVGRFLATGTPRKFFFNFIKFFFFFCSHRAAYGILVPLPAIESLTPAVKVRCPNHCTTREFPIFIFFFLGSSDSQSFWEWGILSINNINKFQPPTSRMILQTMYRYPMLKKMYNNTSYCIQTSTLQRRCSCIQKAVVPILLIQTSNNDWLAFRFMNSLQ